MSSLLLVEPNHALARTYQRALELAGHSVVTAHDAETAIHELDNLQTVGAVIMELQLISHDGIEFLYELRSYPEWQHIPVIVQSLVPHRALKTNQRVFDTLGIKHYFYKPFTTLQELTRVVNSLLAPTA